MSYEIVTSVKLDKKNGKIFITSDSNNVYPKTFRKWEFIEDNKNYREKLSKFIHGVIIGNLQFRDSLVRYQYAANKVREYINNNNLYKENYRYENGNLIRTSDDLYYYMDWDKPEFDEHKNNIIDLFENSLSEKIDGKYILYNPRKKITFIKKTKYGYKYYYGKIEEYRMDYKKAYNNLVSLSNQEWEIVKTN